MAWKIVVWDEIQATKKSNGMENAAESVSAAETAQFVLHRPKRQAVKVRIRTMHFLKSGNERCELRTAFNILQLTPKVFRTRRSIYYCVSLPCTIESEILKLCDGAISHVSTITGGNPTVDDEHSTPVEDVTGSENERVTESGEAATYVVVAGEDGAVRFYDLKFRLEVRCSRGLNDVMVSDTTPYFCFDSHRHLVGLKIEKRVPNCSDTTL